MDDIHPPTGWRDKLRPAVRPLNFSHLRPLSCLVFLGSRFRRNVANSKFLGMSSEQKSICSKWLQFAFETETCFHERYLVLSIIIIIIIRAAYRFF